MRTVISATLLTLIMILSLVAAASAAPFINPSDDTFVRQSTPAGNFNNTNLSVAGSTTACNVTDTTFLQWDLSSVPDSQTVADASLTLTLVSRSFTGSPAISLYEAGDDYLNTTNVWDETGLTANNAPSPLGNILDTKPAPTVAGQTIVFNSAALATYLNNQVHGDNIVSFALRFSTCTGILQVSVFEDKEGTSGQPDLQMFSPTAVEITSLTASSNPAASWAGLIVILPLAAAIPVILIARRRRASDQS
jgi:hypothetical protein